MFTVRTPLTSNQVLSVKTRDGSTVDTMCVNLDVDSIFVRGTYATPQK
jgi:hypothetical protein